MPSNPWTNLETVLINTCMNVELGRIMTHLFEATWQNDDTVQESKHELLMLEEWNNDLVLHLLKTFEGKLV